MAWPLSEWIPEGFLIHANCPADVRKVSQVVARVEKVAVVPKVTETAEGMGETMTLNGSRRNGSSLPSYVLVTLLFTNVLFGGAEPTQEPPQPPAARDGTDGTPQAPDGKPGENGKHGAKGADGGASKHRHQDCNEGCFASLVHGIFIVCFYQVE
jgi:hypothetical protein